MNPWLFRISLSHLTQHPGRTLLGVLGIALGAAVYLAISLAANSALQSFQSGVTAVAGKAQWRLMKPGAPLDESLYPAVRRLPQVKAAAPVVESVLELAGPYQGPVLLLGIDPFSGRFLRDYQVSWGDGMSRLGRDFFLRPEAVLISEKLAGRLGLKPGDALPVMVGPRLRSLQIVGFFSSPRGLYPLDGAVILMDLAPAQELLEREGRLDYIDVLGHGNAQTLFTHLEALAPPGVEVAEPGAATRQMEGLVASYRLNLTVLSAIALFVGMFLIYQSVTLSVVRRRREIGLLRTLGMTPRQVLLLFLAEGLASGLAGGLLGLLLGVSLARGALGMMTQNLTSLYTPVVAQEVGISAGLLLQAWGLAVAATLAAALLPAREAARTRLRAVWHREELEEKIETRAGAIFLAGAAALALAGALSFWKVKTGPPYPGFIAAFLILLAFALFTPLGAKILGRGLQPALRRVLGPAGDLGCRYLYGSLSRSAVSIAALACALGMLIAVVVMIGSFRQTVNDWVSRSISGDIFFGPAVFSTSAYDHYLPPEILPELRRDPDISDIYLYRCVRVPFQDRYVLVIGGSFEVLARHGGLWFRKGDGREIMEMVGGGGQGPTAPAPAHQAVVSEALAETFGIKEGDTLELPTPAGSQLLSVAGVFYDYRTDGPSVWMDIRNFRRFWQDDHLNAVRLYLQDPGRVEEVKARLQQAYGGRYRLLTLSHGELRTGILKIFDETFALTYALEGVAVLVAVFGIITTFLVLIMERERELALLQAMGASRRQILGMVLVESGLASLLSFILGAGAGSVLSLLLIWVINKQAFGWTIHLHWVPAIYGQALILVLALGMAAAAYPAWRALQPHLAAILKEE